TTHDDVHLTLLFLLLLFNDPSPTDLYTLSLHDALPIYMQATDRDGTVHRFWRITSPDAIAAAQAALAEREMLIADGHHRYETARSEEHTSELQSLRHLVCRLLLEKKKKTNQNKNTTIRT